jgi:hypothetical protein
MSSNLAKIKDPIFKERRDGLLEYCGPTDKTAVIAVWRTFDVKIDQDIWGQASVAAAVVPQYGKQDMEDLAFAVEKSVAYVRRMSKTYRYFTQNDTRVSNLSFKHHSIALRHVNPKAALLLASEKGWGCTKLEEWIINKAAEGKDEQPNAPDPIKLSELREFLAHVEEVIQDDFIQGCPDRGFAMRVFAQWKADLREENRQLYIADLREVVKNAIENRGALTVKQIITVTGIRQHDVESAVHWLVIDQEEYEWIEERGETDEARGTHTMILHKIGAPHGGAYTAPRASNHYSN